MNLTAQQLIGIYGSPYRLARVAGIAGPSVYGWMEKGVPELRLIQLGADIERRTNGQITRQLLRPNDWQLIWPELAKEKDGQVD